ncbi:YhgE/Pip domain-containing protein [soil metagenome]
MTIITLVRSEFARLTASRIGIAALVALMIVPVVYGGLYLWGNADPYSKLGQVPAAIVVDDTGATVDGKTVDYGRDTAQQLVADKKFGWVILTPAQAEAGIADGTYDFGITFPADFSSDLASAGGADPTQASLVLTTNDTNSYLSTTIAKQGAEAVRVTLAKKVAENASKTLLEAIDSIRTGLVSARDGAAKLADGAASASTGAASLASGTATLASGAQSLADGLAQLDAQASGLPANASTLAAGASSVATLAPSIRSQLATIFAGSNVSPTDQATILGELGALSSGAAQVSGGAQALKASAPALADAIASAAAGSGTLASGAADAAAGASTLQAGAAQLASGSAELNGSLGQAVTDIPATNAESRAATAAAIADPLAVTQDAMTTAQNYGAGLAPFFISLAAWIGIYALFLLVRPLSRRALTAVRRPIRTTLAGWLTPALLGAVQMLALFAIVTLALGLQPASPLGLLGFMVLVSVTFAAIVLALNIWLGSVGQFLGLLLMIVQLVTAGGTFPWQTLPGPLAFLHQALPMSHAVEGSRQLIYGATPGGLWSAVLPLLCWLVGALVVSVLGALKQGRFRTLRELRPSPLAG